MVTATMDKTIEPWMRRLYLPAYRVSEAARYVGVHPNTVSSWHYRGNPVLHGRTKGRPLSYLELIEVAFVAFFRRLKVSMNRIRSARDYVAKTIEREYPFASLQFKTEGFHILMEYHQFDPSLKWDQLIVTDSHGQLAWEEMMGNRFVEFDYEDEVAMRWHLAGRESQVVIDPRIAFGAPMVSGLPTWVIRGRHEAGETIEEIVEDFEICESAIQDALAFEGVQAA